MGVLRCMIMIIPSRHLGSIILDLSDSTKPLRTVQVDPRIIDTKMMQKCKGDNDTLEMFHKKAKKKNYVFRKT